MKKLFIFICFVIICINNICFSSEGQNLLGLIHVITPAERIKNISKLRIGISKAQAVKFLGIPNEVKSYNNIPLLLSWKREPEHFINITFNMNLQIDKIQKNCVLNKAYIDKFPLCLNKQISQKTTISAAQTLLSKRTAAVIVGMTKPQVKLLLGNPTWADSYTGMPLAWSWRNGNCNPIEITFDRHMKVDSINEGRARCLNRIYRVVPDDKYLCSNPDRVHLC